MTPTLLPDIKSIFGQALEQPSPAERAAFLERACGPNAAVRAEVEGLLAAIDQAGGFLRQPAAPAATADPPSRTVRAGAVIAGRYKLLEQIGEGGMGTVWVAEQTEPVKRRVALKVIKPGMDSRQVLSRFEAERQALALMDHPNIAKIFDGGMTDEARPYFVMEYVKGMPITEYCDSVKLSIPERLKLFVSVCQAVQHAHQKGVIHRDLKPSNILVCLYDGHPVPKVIDFGLAKAISQPLTENTLYTAHGLMVGTPLYMSPEQAEFNNLDVDTRSDIYSLGVILYELLTGTTPLQKQQFKDAAFQEILRLIKEVEPQRPSLKISTSVSLPALAAQRSLEPAQLSRTVRGDLDWIVMKALEKERSRRYETANGLARDVERYLQDAPVEACPPSAAYRLKKVMRRNKGPALAATIVLLALVGGIVGTTWGLIRAEKSRQLAETSRQAEARQRIEAEAARERETARAESEARERRRAESAEAAAEANAKQAAAERDRAEQEQRVAQAVKDFLQNRLLSQADVRKQADSSLEAGETLSETRYNPTIRELLDRAAAELTPEKIEKQFPKLPLVQAEILRTIGNAYVSVREIGPAVAHLERSRDLYIAQLGPDHPDTLTTLLNLAVAYPFPRIQSHAIPLIMQVRDQQIAKLGPDHPDTLTTLDHLAQSYHSTGKYQEAIQLFLQVRDQRVAQLGPDHPDTLETLHHLAISYRNTRKFQEAIPLYKQVYDQRSAKLGRDHPDTVETLHNLAWAYKGAGMFSEAIQLYEQVRDQRIAKLGPDHPAALDTQTRLAHTYANAGRYPEAIQLFEQLQGPLIAKFGPDHTTTLTYLGWFADAYTWARNPSQAIPLYEQLRDKYTAKFGPDSSYTLKAQSRLAAAYVAARRFPQAFQLFEQVRDQQIVKLGPDHADTLWTLNELANAYYSTRRLPEAIQLYEQVRDGRITTLGPDDRGTLDTTRYLANAYRAAGRLPEAVQLVEHMRDRYLATLGPDNSRTLASQRELAYIYRDAGRLPEALRLFEEIVYTARRAFGTGHETTRSHTTVWRFALDQAGQFGKAAEVDRELVKAERERVPTVPTRLAFALASLGLSLLKAEQFAEAETALKESLHIHEQAQTDAPLTYSTKLYLGRSLLAQKKYAEAEPLLLAAYEGLKQSEASTRPSPFRPSRLPETLQHLIDLYTAWDKPVEADRWRTILDDQKTAKTPPSDTTKNP